MLKSMTGFGRSTLSIDGCDFTAEIRSVNHRYLDCSVRVPRLFVFLEDAVKSCVSGRLSRGKVDVFLTVDTKGMEQLTVSLNKPVVTAYLEALRNLQSEFGLSGEPTVALVSRLPDVFTIDKAQPDSENVTKGVVQLVGMALDELEDLRIREGERLCRSIVSQMDVIEELIVRAEKRSRDILPEYHARLEARIRETLGSMPVEDSRLLTEVALFADKIANNEEVVRLRSHLSELSSLLNKNGAQGRKVDFLVQELNREANTIGSKGNDAQLAQIVVEMKSEIEKIREQVQNLE